MLCDIGLFWISTDNDLGLLMKSSLHLYHEELYP